MPRGPLEPLLRHIRSLAAGSSSAELTDEDLLNRFVSRRDQASFALLVERHGRLVRAVCRHLLVNEADIEDAFQATLLVLARKASSIRTRRSVASWLYGVAYRTALKVRTSAARRQKYESQAPARAPEGPVSEAALRELQALLDDEVRRLPEKLRAPFVLCCLEGKSKGEAAQDLGWPEGTVSGRVALARKRLQARLARRGLTLAGALAALAVAEGATSAGAVALAPGVLRAIAAFASRQGIAGGAVSARAVALAESVLWADTTGRLKMVLAVGLLLGVAGAGAGAWWARTADKPPPAGPDAGVANEPAPDDRPALPPRDEKPAAANPGAPAGPGRVFTGRVLDAKGNPRAGAVVAVTGFQSIAVRDSAQVNQAHHVLARARADADGRFTLTLPDATASGYAGLALVATGEGNGPAWELMPGDVPRPGVELRMEKPHALRGRLLDPQGRPAAGVEARVVTLSCKEPRPRTLHFADPGSPGGELDEVVRTDGDGAFEVHGFPGCVAQLLVRDERFAPQWVILRATNGARTDAGPIRLEPRRILEGTVVDVETGRPLGGVRVSGMSASSKYAGVGPRHEEAHTDAEGRFQLAPFPGESITLLLSAPESQPYLIAQHYLEWRDDRPRQVKVTMRRGVLLKGRLTEKASGKAVAGANVSFHPRTIDHPILSHRHMGETGIAWWLGHTTTGTDGSYRIVALPGAGHLIVKASSSDYIPVETTTGMFQAGKPGGEPAYPDGLVALDLPAGSEPREVPVELRRGVTLTARVVGSDGKPVARGALLCPTLLTSAGGGYGYQGLPLMVTGGRFELPGRDPDRPTLVFVYDPQRKEGARAEMSASGEPTVRLVPCRKAVVRFVGGDGKPAVGVRVGLDLVVHPRGAPAGGSWASARSGYAVEAQNLAGPRCVTPGPPGSGEMTFSGLIPGATYLIEVGADPASLPVVVKEFTVKADEDPRVPDIVVRRSPATRPPR